MISDGLSRKISSNRRALSLIMGEWMVAINCIFGTVFFNVSLSSASLNGDADLSHRLYTMPGVFSVIFSSRSGFRTVILYAISNTISRRFRNPELNKQIGKVSFPAE